MVPKCPQDSQEVNRLYISILYSRCVTGSPVSIIRTKLSHDVSQRKMMTLATARICSDITQVLCKTTVCTSWFSTGQALWPVCLCFLPSVHEPGVAYFMSRKLEHAGHVTTWYNMCSLTSSKEILRPGFVLVRIQFLPNPCKITFLSSVRISLAMKIHEKSAQLGCHISVAGIHAFLRAMTLSLLLANLMSWPLVLIHPDTSWCILITGADATWWVGICFWKANEGCQKSDGMWVLTWPSWGWWDGSGLGQSALPVPFCHKFVIGDNAIEQNAQGILTGVIQSNHKTMRDLSESSLFCLDFLFRYRSQNTRNGFGLWEERAESLLSCLRRLLRAQSLKHVSSLWIKFFQLSPLSRMFVEGSFTPRRDCTFRSHELRLRHKNYSFRKLLRCCKGFKHVKLLMDENHRDAAQNYGVYQALPSHAVTRWLCTEDRLKFDRRKMRVFSDPVFLLLYRPGHLTDLGDFATPAPEVRKNKETHRKPRIQTKMCLNAFSPEFDGVINTSRPLSSTIEYHNYLRK